MTVKQWTVQEWAKEREAKAQEAERMTRLSVAAFEDATERANAVKPDIPEPMELVMMLVAVVICLVLVCVLVGCSREPPDPSLADLWGTWQ